MSEDHPYVYLMRRADGSWKIGFSINPKLRRKCLQSTTGVRFRIVRTWQREDAYRVEQIAHRILRLRMDLRAEGRETYRAPRSEMLAAVEEAMKRADEYGSRPQEPKRFRKPRKDDPAQEARIAELVEQYAKRIEVINARR